MLGDFLLKMNRDMKILGAFGLVLCAAILLKRKFRRTRRFKVRPINQNRRQTGNFSYYQTMKSWDTDQFFKFTRMTVPVFDKLLGKIRSTIARQHRSDGVSPEERLIITLQYLSQGTSMQALAWTFNLGHTTVHKIIHETCKALWENLHANYLKTPESVEEWLKISEGFKEKWNFPHCLGSIDEHVKIQAPAKSGSLFFNYKKTFSIVLLGTCDAKYRFTFVDIGGYGSQSDGGVLNNSIFGQRLQSGSMNLPGPRPLPQTNIEMPYFLVGDEAFPLRDYLMRPYPNTNLTQTQRIFNYRLSRARQTIENTFGILVSRWRILKTTINAKPENVDNIVKATVVLHNYCLLELRSEANIYCPAGFVDSGDQQNGLWREDEAPLRSVGRVGANISRRDLYAMRNLLADYFVSDIGQVPWQNEIVNRGRVFI